MQLLKEGKVQVWFLQEAGGLMAGGLFVVGRIKGLTAAIATVFPASKGPILLLDIGATVK